MCGSPLVGDMSKNHRVAVVVLRVWQCPEGLARSPDAGGSGSSIRAATRGLGRTSSMGLPDGSSMGVPATPVAGLGKGSLAAKLPNTQGLVYRSSSVATVAMAMGRARVVPNIFLIFPYGR